jgi:hypothetical protein
MHGVLPASPAVSITKKQGAAEQRPHPAGFPSQRRQAKLLSGYGFSKPIAGKRLPDIYHYMNIFRIISVEYKGETEARKDHFCNSWQGQGAGPHLYQLNPFTGGKNHPLLTSPIFTFKNGGGIERLSRTSLGIGTLLPPFLGFKMGEGWKGGTFSWNEY